MTRRICGSSSTTSILPALNLRDLRRWRQARNRMPRPGPVRSPPRSSRRALPQCLLRSPAPFRSPWFRNGGACPRKNFSKMRERSFSSMPGPRSATPITIFPPLSAAEIVEGRALGRIFERVLDELLHHLPDELVVGFGRGKSPRAHRTVTGRPLSARGQFGQRAGDEVRHRHRPLLQVELAGLDAGHLHHFRRQLIQPVGLFVDDGEQLAVGAGRAAQQAGDRGFDGGERRLDIVRQRIEQRRFQHLALAARLRRGWRLPGRALSRW